MQTTTVSKTESSYRATVALTIKVFSIAMLVWVTALLTKVCIDYYLSSTPSNFNSKASWSALLLEELMLVAISASYVNRASFLKLILVTMLLSVVAAIIVSYGLH